MKPFASLGTRVDQLVAAPPWPTSSLTFSFPTVLSEDHSGQPGKETFSPLTSAQKDAVRAALATDNRGQQQRKPREPERQQLKSASLFVANAETLCVSYDTAMPRFTKRTFSRMAAARVGPREVGRTAGRLELLSSGSRALRR